MSKCMICGKDSGKGKTCSSTCRSKLARSVAKDGVSVANATVEECCKPSVANPKPRTFTDQEFTMLMAQANWRTKPLRVSVPGDVDYDGVCLDAKYDNRRSPQACAGAGN